MNGLEESITVPVHPPSHGWFFNELIGLRYSVACENEQPPEIPQELVARLSKTTQPIPEVRHLFFHINNHIKIPYKALCKYQFKLVGSV